MTTHWGLFASGVVLLLFPADRLLSRRVQLRSFGCFQSLEDSPRHRPWWWVPLLWVDPFRGFAGAVCLKTSLGLSGSEWASFWREPYAIVVALLCLGVMCQLFTRRDREAFLAPIGFVAGIVTALTPWTVALIGLTMALAGMFAFRSFVAFFVLGVASVGALGLALGASPLWLIPSLVVLALPAVWRMASGRALEIPTRSSAPGRAVVARP